METLSSVAQRDQSALLAGGTTGLSNQMMFEYISQREDICRPEKIFHQHP